MPGFLFPMEAFDRWYIFTAKSSELRLAPKPLRSQLGAAGEIHLRRVARRQIAGTEHDTTDRRQVRRDGLPTRKVPLGDEGIDGAGILRVPANPELVDGDDVHRHLEAAAQGVAA